MPLADPTRRAMVERPFVRPGQRQRSLGARSRCRFPRSPSIWRRSNGPVSSSARKSARVRTCRIEAKALGEAEQWINARRLEWERKLDRLGAYLEELTKEGNDNGEPT